MFPAFEFYRSEDAIYDDEELLMLDGSLELRVLVDRSSVEVFANDGRYTNTNLIFPEPSSTGVSLTTHGGSAELRELTAYEVSTDAE